MENKKIFILKICETNCDYNLSNNEKSQTDWVDVLFNFEEKSKI